MTLIRTTLLGTSAAQPTLRRGLSSISVQAFGEHLLFDCGEGTQRQMLRFGVGLRLDLVFFTHFHADHYLGIIGLIRTLSMGGQAQPLRIYGPAPFITETLPRMLRTGTERLSLQPEFCPLEDGDVVQRAHYSVRAVGAVHRVPTLSYVLEQHQRPGRFDVARALSLGVPAGPLFKQLQRGHAVRSELGEWVNPEQVLGPPRRGIKLCFSGDTRPTDALARAATAADVLVHEATFSQQEQERALYTQHSTAHEAGEVATRAAVERLVLTHFSSRYDNSPQTLVAEARRSFSGRIVAAEDGYSFDLPERSPGATE